MYNSRQHAERSRPQRRSCPGVVGQPDLCTARLPLRDVRSESPVRTAPLYVHWEQIWIGRLSCHSQLLLRWEQILTPISR
jgi:hypothetical protein